MGNRLAVDADQVVTAGLVGHHLCEEMPDHGVLLNIEVISESTAVVVDKQDLCHVIFLKGFQEGELEQGACIGPFSRTRGKSPSITPVIDSSLWPALV